MYIAHHTGYENDFVFWNDGMGCMTMDFKEGRLFDRCHDYLQGVGLKVLLMLEAIFLRSSYRQSFSFVHRHLVHDRLRDGLRSCMWRIIQNEFLPRRA